MGHVNMVTTTGNTILLPYIYLFQVTATHLKIVNYGCPILKQEIWPHNKVSEW